MKSLTTSIKCRNAVRSKSESKNKPVDPKIIKMWIPKLYKTVLVLISNVTELGPMKNSLLVRRDK